MFKLDVTKIGSSEQKGSQDDIKIAFELPDGKTSEMKFRRDLTVGYMKHELEKKHQLPYANIELRLGDTELADPLSLTDYPAIKNHSGGALKIGVKVVGEVEKVDQQTISQIQKDLQNTADVNDDDSD